MPVTSLLEDYGHLWIQTATGIKFNLIAPEPGSMQLDDIAAALSKICRFNGHTKEFYSVAEHCVRMARELNCEGHPLMTQFWALMHDAVETYICDIPSPVKRALDDLSWHYLLGYGSYKQLYDSLEKHLLSEFGIVMNPCRDQIVAVADKRMLATERQQLMGSMLELVSDAEWGGLGGIEPYPDMFISCWTPFVAEGLFKREFDRITQAMEEFKNG